MNELPETAVGIDVSYHTLSVFIDGDSQVREFSNDDAGHQEVLADLTRGRRRVRVVLEATGTYHLDAALALSANKRCRVSVVNPRSTKHFHEAQNIRAKTDSVDAKSLCAYALRMEFVEWVRPDGTALALRALVREQAQLTKERTRTTNRAHALQVSDSTPQALHDMLARQVEFIDAQLAELDAVLKRFERDHPSVGPQVQRLVTIPGIARTTALRLLSEFLLLDPTMDAKEVTAWAGLDPRPNQSGTSDRRRSISKRGSSRARAALYFPAVTAARVQGPLQDFHQRIVERSGQSMIGIIALMRKLLTIAWAMHRNDTEWNPELAMPKNPKKREAA